ncbi:MAG: hypothetical protein LBS51_03775, partial [Oscillospiraceae bacterium]|nr:hypothetical protein [Oscillospiraceae bacterium]
APTANAEGDAPPVIERHPSDGTFAKSATLRLYVTAYSQTDSALTYEWSAVDEEGGAVDIPATDNGKSVLTTETPDTAGTYTYSVTVTDANAPLSPAESSATITIVDKVLPKELLNGKFEEFVYTGKFTGNGGASSQYDKDAFYHEVNLYGAGKETRTFGTQSYSFAHTSQYHPDWNVVGWNTTHNRAGYSAGVNSAYLGTDADGVVGGWSGGAKTIEITRPAAYLHADGNRGNIAQLYASAKSSIYQEVATVPGKIYEWSLVHSGQGNTSTDDIVAVVIGPSINAQADYGDMGVTSYWNADGGVSGPYVYGLNANTHFQAIVDKVYAEQRAGSDSLLTFGQKNAGKSFSVLYGGKPYYVSICFDPGATRVFTPNSGSYTVPAGQGTTVFGFVSVYLSGSGNNLDDIVFVSVTQPKPEQAATYTGDTSVTVTTQTGYAYTLAEVRGSSVRTLDGLTASYDNDGALEAWQPLEAAANAALGDGVSWYTDAKPVGGVDFTADGELTFDDLTPGKTYRVIGVPASTISKTLHTNQTPADVLDESCYYDVKIIPAPEESEDYVAPLAAGVYLDKAFVTLANSRGDTEYALLKEMGAGTGVPDIGTPVHDWVLGGGTLRFDDLAPDSTYFLVARPVGYTEVTYADAAYTSTGDIFARKIKTPAANYDLAAGQVTRKIDGGDEVIAITGIKDNWTYALVDVTDGKIVASKAAEGVGDVSFDAAGGIEAGATYQVVAKPDVLGGDYMAGVRVYPFPAALAVDYARDRIGSATGSIPKTVEYKYKLEDDSKYTKKSGEYYIDLTEAQLDDEDNDDRTITYRFSPDDGYTDASVQPESTLEFPQRPAAPVTTNYALDYAAETLGAVGAALEYRPDGGAWTPLTAGTVGFSAVGWTGAAKSILLRFPAATTGADEDKKFASGTLSAAIAGRPAAPSGLTANAMSEGVISISGVTADTKYEYRIIDTNTIGPYIDETPTVTEITGITIAEGQSVDVRLAATTVAPASRSVTLKPAEPIIIEPVDLGAITYGADVTAKNVAVRNTTNDTINGVTFTLGGDDAGKFKLSVTDSVNVTSGPHNQLFTIDQADESPVPAGEYSVKIRATYGDGKTAEAEVSLTVSKAEWWDTTAPTVAAVSGVSDVSESGFTVNVTGAPEGATLEFRLGAEGVWAEDDDAVGAGGDASYTFKNLTA